MDPLNPQKDQDACILPLPRDTRYGRLRAAPFFSDERVPDDADVVIIGAGICGVLTAYFLAKQGVKICVCEKAEVACEASSRAFGWVTQLLTSAEKVKLTRASKQLWATLQNEIGDIGYRQNGVAYFAETEQELEEFKGWYESVKNVADQDIEFLNREQIKIRYPELTQQYIGAILAPSDGCIEPIITTTRIAEAAQKLGVRFVTSCAVRGVDIQNNKVVGVYTEQGYIKTSRVLSAVNTWSRIFCGNHDIDIPQLYVIMSMGRLGACQGPVGNGGIGSWAWRSQIDGGYALGLVTGMSAPITRDAIKLFARFRPLQQMLGGSKAVKISLGKNTWTDWSIKRRWDPRKTSPFEKLRVLSGEVDPSAANTSKTMMSNVFPQLETNLVEEHWCGSLAFTPDNVPIAGAIDNVEGFYLITGCGYGYSWGPKLTSMLANLIQNKVVDKELYTYRLSRFSDGSVLELQP